MAVLVFFCFVLKQRNNAQQLQRGRLTCTNPFCGYLFPAGGHICGSVPTWNRYVDPEAERQQDQ